MEVETTPEEIVAVKGLAENLQMQDRVAKSMKDFRHTHGALSLETIESKPVFDGDQIRVLEIEEKNRAKEIIEDFMVAANGVTARYLSVINFLRSDGWSAFQNDGIGLSKSRQNTSSGFRMPGFKGIGGFSRQGKKPQIRCASPTYLWL